MRNHYFLLFLIVNILPLQHLSEAITNVRRSSRNEYYNGESSNLEWQTGLREAMYQVLQRHIRNPSLRNYLISAPIVGFDNSINVPLFGDVTIIAKGQLYLNRRGFLYVQDRYQNDCEECHNPLSRCSGRDGNCHAWTPIDDEKLIALWTVKRIRHREHEGSFRYELKYTISPTGESVPLGRDGRFDYDIPGHNFILRDKNFHEKLKENYRTYDENPLPPRHRFRFPNKTKPTPFYIPNNQIDETPPSDRDVFKGRQTTSPRTREDFYKNLLETILQRFPSFQQPIDDNGPKTESNPPLHHSSSTYATHIKMMQDTLSTHTKLPLPTMSKDYSKTTKYSFADPSTGIKPQSIVPVTRPYFKERKIPNYQTSSTTLRPFIFTSTTNRVIASPETIKKDKITTKTTTSSVVTYMKKEPIRKILPTLTEKTKELEIIPVTDQNELINLLKPITDIIKIKEHNVPMSITTTTIKTNMEIPQDFTTKKWNQTENQTTIVEIQKSEGFEETNLTSTEEVVTENESTSTEVNENVENSTLALLEEVTLPNPQTNDTNTTIQPHNETNKPTIETTTLVHESTVSLSKETVVEVNNLETSSTSTTTPKITTTTRGKLQVLTKKINETKSDDNFENELFGPQKTTTTTTTTQKTTLSNVEKLGESDESILEELFGSNSVKPTKMDEGSDPELFAEKSLEESKVIFSNFYFAPTEKPENVTLSEEQKEHLKVIMEKPIRNESTLILERLNMTAHYTTEDDQQQQQDVPTAQSVSSSVTYVVNRINKTETVKRKARKPLKTSMIKAKVKEVANSNDEIVVYEAEFPEFTDISVIEKPNGKTDKSNINYLPNDISFLIENRTKVTEKN